MELTKDSKSTDFACICCGNGELNEHVLRAMLQVLEHTGEKSIAVTSGFRCPSHNADPKVGGSPHSKHLTGEALDFYAPTVQIKEKLVNAAHSVGLKGIGLGSTLVHLDNREVALTWTYPIKKYKIS